LSPLRRRGRNDDGRSPVAKPRATNAKFAHAVTTAPSGTGPDVLSIDTGLGWLYLAAESGDLTVFDINQPGLVLLGHDQPGNNSHSVAADPTTHRVFFPLMKGPNGTPVLRMMKPSGT
jgi:hypothetical protein